MSLPRVRVGVPVACQNGHRATWWFALRDLEWVPDGMDVIDKCDCPKCEMGQGYRRVEGAVELSSAPG